MDVDYCTNLFNRLPQMARLEAISLIMDTLESKDLDNVLVLIERQLDRVDQSTHKNREVSENTFKSPKDNTLNNSNKFKISFLNYLEANVAKKVKTESEEKQYSFSNPYKDVNQHKKAGHLKIRPHKCELCNKEFTKMHHLERHKETHLKRYPCDQCDYIANKKNNLTVHRDSVHKGVSYSCDQCDYNAPIKANFKLHMELIHGKVYHSCNQCHYKAACKKNLNVHVKSVHQKISVTCGKCDKQFSTKASLWLHNSSLHMGIFFPCEFCDYKANQKEHLRRHTLTHHKN